MRTTLLLALTSLTTACALDTSSTQSEVNVNTKNEVLSKELIKSIQKRTQDYRKAENAIADGWIPYADGECFAEEEDGELHAVGAFFDYPDAIDGVIDPLQPESLLYEPQADGSFELTGVEYWVPFDLWTDANPPTLEGVPLNYEEDMGMWGLHVWVWRENPEGITAESNPNVHCP